MLLRSIPAQISVVVGLTEYLWKKYADIFLCVIYSKVVYIFSAYLSGKQISASISISSRFDTILKYFLAFTPILSRYMRGIHLEPWNVSFSSAVE